MAERSDWYNSLNAENQAKVNAKIEADAAAAQTTTNTVQRQTREQDAALINSGYLGGERPMGDDGRQTLNTGGVRITGQQDFDPARARPYYGTEWEPTSLRELQLLQSGQGGPNDGAGGMLRTDSGTAPSTAGRGNVSEITGKTWNDMNMQERTRHQLGRGNDVTTGGNVEEAQSWLDSNFDKEGLQSVRDNAVDRIREQQGQDSWKYKEALARQSGEEFTLQENGAPRPGMIKTVGEYGQTEWVDDPNYDSTLEADSTAVEGEAAAPGWDGSVPFEDLSPENQAKFGTAIDFKNLTPEQQTEFNKNITDEQLAANPEFQQLMAPVHDMRDITGTLEFDVSSADDIGDWHTQMNKFRRQSPEAFRAWEDENPAMAIRWNAWAGNKGMNYDPNNPDWSRQHAKDRAQELAWKMSQDLGYGEDGHQDGQAIAYDFDTFKDVNNNWGAGDWWKLGTPQTTSESPFGNLINNPVVKLAALALAPATGGASTSVLALANMVNDPENIGLLDLASVAGMGGDFLETGTILKEGVEFSKMGLAETLLNSDVDDLNPDKIGNEAPPEIEWQDPDVTDDITALQVQVPDYSLSNKDGGGGGGAPESSASSEAAVEGSGEPAPELEAGDIEIDPVAQAELPPHDWPEPTYDFEGDPDYTTEDTSGGNIIVTHTDTGRKRTVGGTTETRDSGPDEPLGTTEEPTTQPEEEGSDIISAAIQAAILANSDAQIDPNDPFGDSTIDRDSTSDGLGDDGIGDTGTADTGTGDTGASNTISRDSSTGTSGTTGTGDNGSGDGTDGTGEGDGGDGEGDGVERLSQMISAGGMLAGSHEYQPFMASIETNFPMLSKLNLQPKDYLKMLIGRM